MKFSVRGWRAPFYLVGALAVFMGAFRASSTSGVEVRIHRDKAPNVDTLYVPLLRSAPGPQLVMVYFGAASCAASNQEGLPEAVETLKVRLARLARERELPFVVVGAALDWRPEIGVEHLAKFGRFDEIAAGYNWGNSLGVKYMWENRSIRPSTPQVAVYRRVFTTPLDSAGPSAYGDTDLELIATAPGADRIQEWVDTDEITEVVVRFLEGG